MELLKKQYSCWKEGRYAKSSYPKLQSFLKIYTFIFIISFLIVYAPFFIRGKTLIDPVDGCAQYYPILVYISKYLKGILWNILHGDFKIPLFDLSIGVGSDIISSLNYYGLGDPLVLLSVFVPVKYMEFFYVLLVIVRLYLSGLAFSALCTYHGKQMKYTLVGALIYIYSGYALYTSIRHPLFLNPMIQLPFLLIGIDKIIKRKKTLIFSVFVCYSALCGYYFLYMMTIMLGFYALTRFKEIYIENRGKEFLQMSGRIVANYILGIGLSSITFIPSVIGYLNSSRADAAVCIRPFYNWSLYITRVQRFIAPSVYFSNLSLPAIALLALVLLFMTRKKYRSLKELFMIAALLYSFPICESVMNGFSYPSSRWTFGFALLISYITVEMLPVLLYLNKWQELLLVLVMFVYAISCWHFYNRSIDFQVAIVILFISVVILVIHTYLLRKIKENIKTASVFMCMFLVLCNAITNVFCSFVINDDINGFFECGVLTEQMNTSIEYKFKEINPQSSGRIDGITLTPNQAMAMGVETVFSGLNVGNCNVYDFWKQTENNTLTSPSCIFYGADQRMITNTLLSTKYFTATEWGWGANFRPYGYELLENEEVQFIYTNKYALPWGYTYDDYISYEALGQMNGLEKEEAMLQSIVLENDIKEVPKGIINSNIESIPYIIKESKGVQWEKGMLLVEEAGATLTLEFDMPEKVEGYIDLEEFNIDDSGLNSFYVKVDCGDISKSALACSKYYNYYFGRENLLFNLGYSEEKRTDCVITFPYPGVYQMENIEIFALPVSGYSQQVERLRAEPMTKIDVEANKIIGEVDLSDNKILCMSIPYGEGWSARIDGKRTDILKGNIMFMAIPLMKGKHSIELTYCTPGLRTGFLISILSVLILWKKTRKIQS